MSKSPPTSFPQPFVYPGSTAYPTTSTTLNPSHLPEGPPPGSIRLDPGVHPPHQPANASMQPSDPLPMRRTTNPHFDASTHALAPAPPHTLSHSSSSWEPSAQMSSSRHVSQPPEFPTPSLPRRFASTSTAGPQHSHTSSLHPSSQLPLSGPVSHSSFPTGGYASHPSGPPSPYMTQRATTLPIPGQENHAQSAPYQTVPAPGITHQASHSGIPGDEGSVPGSWSYHDDGQRDSSSEDDLSASGRRPMHPQWEPQALQQDRLSPCRLCGMLTQRNVYDCFGGYCSERHRERSYGVDHRSSRGEQTEKLVRQSRNAFSCKLCGRPTPRLEHGRFDGFCSEFCREEHRVTTARP